MAVAKKIKDAKGLELWRMLHLEYEPLEGNKQLADFTGYDSGEFTTTATSYTLTGLTAGRTYYMRVLARNAQGSGSYCAYTDADCIVGTAQASAVAAT